MGENQKRTRRNRQWPLRKTRTKVRIATETATARRMIESGIAATMTGKEIVTMTGSVAVMMIGNAIATTTESGTVVMTTETVAARRNRDENDLRRLCHFSFRVLRCKTRYVVVPCLAAVWRHCVDLHKH